MEAPLIRVNSVAPKSESDDEVVIPEFSPETARKSHDYKNLGVLLRKNGYQHHDKNHSWFWSDNLLKRILSEKHIFEELAEYEKKHKKLKGQDIQLLTDAIMFSGEGDSSAATGSCYLKIFAMLVLISEGHCIGDFIHEKVCDDDTPLVACTTSDSWDSMLSRRQSPDRPLDCLRDWDIDKREMFIKWQHILNVVYLGLDGKNRIQHLVLDSKVVFPWLKYRGGQEGGYGSVYRAVAPPDCHGFKDVLGSIVFNNCFAVKVLRHKDEERMKEEETHFWKEVDMLKRFSGLFHAHLVTLLMTWRIQDRHYFLFPWAPCDLEAYWKTEENWSVDRQTGCVERDTMCWISKQVLGIAEALFSIHNPIHLKEAKFGRHGDLKPENILWYESPEHPKGILVIADFGLGSFNSAKSRSNIPGEAIPVTPNYRPPECDLEGGKISRSFDIWTLGCLLLELTCWVLGGDELRGKFEDERTTLYITGCQTDIFFDVKKEENSEDYVVKRKKEVTEWIIKLHNHPACTQYFHRLLDIIEEDMLLVLTPTKERIACSALVDEIRKMHDKVTDITYSQKPCPEKRKPKKDLAFKGPLNQTARRNIQRGGGEGLGVHRGEVRKSKDPDQLRALGP
ncbi:kinase-like protein [Decorospora gaudefroyi]|uniref:Kinase-like protein n=1 Tax=Decorospora gaudefroyi TaxID=184978 RepID=A0A6A5K6I6_9PLEO|nr:kinase-like protein [Decorospora gaudefroyi]